MKCNICKKKLATCNKSGFCTKCYIKSPQFREYQRLKQREWYAKPENKKKKHKYVTTPSHRKHRKVYMRKYTSEHLDRMRELKRNWEREHREERKEYRHKYMKQWRKKQHDKT
jgi:hypothetical protein